MYHPSKQEAQLMLTTGSTRLAVSRGQQTWYHSTCYICARLRTYVTCAVGRKVLWSSAYVCLSVCLSVRTVFVRKISQEPVHGSPPNLVGGSRGWTSRTSSILVL